MGWGGQPRPVAMENEPDTDIPKWVLNPAEYLAPSNTEAEPKIMDEVNGYVIW